MTYSIIAYDPATKQLGVGVQTHQPSVGSVVPWVKPGVGAVATQSLTNIGFGPLGLDLLDGGLDAEHALAALLASDPGAAQRQVAIVDHDGKVAAHTGERCIPEAGHQVGEHYSVQANMMLNQAVPTAMAAAFEGAAGHLVQRLMLAMEAAEALGGDIRGSQSAAILVMSSDPAKPDWENRVANLRVDEHSDPITELRRLVDFQLANIANNAAHELAEKGDLDGALAGFAAARAQCADASEMIFWQALALADNHARIPEARALLQPLFDAEPQWAELLPRLGPVGLIDHPEIIEQLLQG